MLSAELPITKRVEPIKNSFQFSNQLLITIIPVSDSNTSIGGKEVTLMRWDSSIIKYSSSSSNVRPCININHKYNNQHDTNTTHPTTFWHSACFSFKSRIARSNFLSNSACDINNTSLRKLWSIFNSNAPSTLPSLKFSTTKNQTTRVFFITPEALKTWDW